MPRRRVIISPESTRQLRMPKTTFPRSWLSWCKNNESERREMTKRAMPRMRRCCAMPWASVAKFWRIFGRGKFFLKIFGILKYFNSFPPKPEHAEKLHRMHANICAFDDNSLSPLERDYPTSATLGEMRDMVAAARSKFAHYESRNAKKRWK